MKPTHLFAALTVASCALVPDLRAELKTFDEVRSAIAHAKANQQLICFVLTREFDDASETVRSVVKEELFLHDKEFVVVECQYSDATDRSLFEGRFKQDLSKVPMAVITDSSGILIQAAQGGERDTYATMIRKARVTAGFEKDPAVVAAVKEGKDPDMVIGGNLFGVKEGDVASESVALTKERSWAFTNGVTMEAALLSMEGSVGTFRKKDGTKIQVRFEDLSVNDQVFIRNNVFGRGDQ